MVIAIVVEHQGVPEFHITDQLGHPLHTLLWRVETEIVVSFAEIPRQPAENLLADNSFGEGYIFRKLPAG